MRRETPFEIKLKKRYHILSKSTVIDSDGKKTIIYVVKEKTLIERLNEIANMRPFENIRTNGMIQ